MRNLRVFLFWQVLRIFLLGRLVGWSVSRSVRRWVGPSVSRLVGRSLGRLLGWSVGRLLGCSVAPSVGRLVGWSVGLFLGRSVCQSVGWSVQDEAPRKILEGNTHSVEVLQCREEAQDLTGKPGEGLIKF